MNVTYLSRRFHLLRKADESGVSGTGIVAQGVEFSNGQCVLCWLTPVSSVTFYQSARAVEAIHGHAGRTVLVWDDLEEGAKV